MRQKKLKQKTATRAGGNYSSWLMVGTLLIVFALGLYIIQQYTDDSPTVEQLPIPIANNQATPKFEFYTLLPKAKVTVVTTSTDKPAVLKQLPDKPLAHVKTTSSTQFIIQIASLKHRIDADRLKAELLLSGFNANIQAISHKNTTWYRVSVGPFTSQQQAERKRQALADKHGGAIIRKIG